MPRTKSMGRAANGNGSIRKKTVTRNGKKYTYYEARATVGHDMGTGKQIQRSVTGKAQKEVRQKLSQIVADLDEGTYIPPSKETLGEWLDTWVDTYVVPNVKPYTVDSYRSVCKNHIKPALGSVKLEQLTAPQIQQFYNKLQRDKGLSAKLKQKGTAVLDGVAGSYAETYAKANNISFVADISAAPDQSPAPASPTKFTDVAASSPFVDAINWAVEKNITAGKTATGEECTNGQILTFLWRANGSPEPMVYDPFTDPIPASF